MTLNKVDLPQPEGPITPTNSPGATLSETWSTAVRTPSGVSKRLTMSSTIRMAFADAACGAAASIRSKGTAAIVPFPALHLARHGSSVCLAQASAIAHPARRKYEAPRCNAVAGNASDAGQSCSDQQPVAKTPDLDGCGVTSNRWTHHARATVGLSPTPPGMVGRPAGTNFPRRG